MTKLVVASAFLIVAAACAYGVASCIRARRDPIGGLLGPFMAAGLVVAGLVAVGASVAVYCL
jgi:hypothetical protein